MRSAANRSGGHGDRRSTWGSGRSLAMRGIADAAWLRGVPAPRPRTTSGFASCFGGRDLNGGWGHTRLGNHRQAAICAREETERYRFGRRRCLRGRPTGRGFSFAARSRLDAVTPSATATVARSPTVGFAFPVSKCWIVRGSRTASSARRSWVSPRRVRICRMFAAIEVSARCTT